MAIHTTTPFSESTSRLHRVVGSKKNSDGLGLNLASPTVNTVGGPKSDRNWAATSPDPTLPPDTFSYKTADGRNLALVGIQAENAKVNGKWVPVSAALVQTSRSATTPLHPSDQHLTRTPNPDPSPRPTAHRRSMTTSCHCPRCPFPMDSSSRSACRWLAEAIVEAS
jgi:hypothetical protein